MPARTRSTSPKRRQLLEERAAYMKRCPTESEEKLWQALRGGAAGVAFRRQAVVGEAIVDFVAPAVRLIVEVDGTYHNFRRAADARRDAKLRRLGYRVVRIEAEVVLADLGGAVALVKRALAEGQQ